MKQEKLSSAEKIAEIYKMYNDMDDVEKIGLLNDLKKHNAFSDVKSGGIELIPEMHWYTIMLEWGDEEGAVWNKYSTKSEAVAALNSHHEECGLPNYDEMSPELQNHLVFKAPGDFKILIKGSDDEYVSTNLTHEEQQKEIANHNYISNSTITNLRNDGKMVKSWYPNANMAISAHKRHVEAQIYEITSKVQANIESWEPSFEAIKDINKNVKMPKPDNWIQYHSEPTASTVDAIYEVIKNKHKKIVTIASVLFKSHTILEPNFNKESDGRRKPINSNEVHGVYTTSNPKKVLARMTRLGFDNQPIYCDVAKRCVAMITLKESIKFLTKGALEHEDFTDYQKMKKNRLLREPPPMFTPFDSVELAVSLFNAGCESVLFNFDSEEWLVNGGDPEVCEILENGIHIFTPHDVVAYFTK